MLLNLFLIILIAPPQLLAAGNSLSSCPKVKWQIPGRPKLFNYFWPMLIICFGIVVIGISVYDLLHIGLSKLDSIQLSIWLLLHLPRCLSI